MEKPFNFHSIILKLENSDLISKIEKTHIDEISQRGFYKIKCRLIPSKYNLEIKFIDTGEEFIYSYQLYSTTSIVRWDNEPHFPDIETFPHHFHDTGGNVLESSLMGDPEIDLYTVLSKTQEFLT
jgi:hypothetical protein